MAKKVTMLRQPDPHPGTAPVYPQVLKHLRSKAGTFFWYALNLPLLEKALRQRVEHGTEKYGRPLEAHNGRNASMDAWEEAVDLVFYLKQARMEGEEVGSLLHGAVDILTELTWRVQAELEHQVAGEPEE